MLNIAIIGCGNIGSRHLQSLVQLQEPTQVFLVESYEPALQTAVDRFHEVLPSGAEDNIIINPLALSELPPELDVAILATGAKGRAQLTSALLEITKPTHLILEKYLFQKRNDYDTVKLLIKNGPKTWVNQWVSSAYAFRRVGTWLGNSSELNMLVFGEEWGLECNSVHFIDYFDYLTGCPEYDETQVEFDGEPKPSKRDGYQEIFGKIFIKTKSGQSLELNCKRGQNNGTVGINLSNGEKSVEILLNEGFMDCVFIENDKSWKEKFGLHFQSNLTHTIVEKLMISGKCDLPSYGRSCVQHLLIHEPMENYFNRFPNWDGEGCPIT